MDLDKAIHAFQVERQDLLRAIEAVEKIIEIRKKRGKQPAAVKAPKNPRETPKE